MADYYTQFSFPFVPTQEERELLLEIIKISDLSSVEPRSEAFIRVFPPAVPSDPCSGFRAFLEPLLADNWIEHWDEVCLPDVIASEDGSICIVGEESENGDIMDQIIRKVCPSALPILYSFASTCSRPIPDSFAGGLVLIERQAVTAMSLLTLLDAFRKGAISVENIAALIERDAPS